MRRAVFALGLVLALSGGAHGQIRPPRIEGFQPAEPIATEIEADIIDRTNAFRVGQGLRPLTENPVLTAEARDFADYLARTGEFSHTADGRSPAQRAAAAGYDYCVLSENIGFEQSGRGFRKVDLAADLTNSWIRSPKHRRNMTDAEVVEIGVGVERAPGDPPKFIAVQVFGRPQSLRYGFRVFNHTGQIVRYAFNGRAQTIPPGTTISHTACMDGELVFKAPGPAGLQPFPAEPGAVYVLQPDAAGGVRVDVTRRGA
jgi:uncharacterized protein YkwD